MSFFQKNVSLDEHSNYKIGGQAEYFALVKNAEEVILAVREARKLKKEIFILGGGTNILFQDGVLKGAVLKTGFDKILKEGEEIVVGSGVSVEELLNFCTENSLSGLEWAGGLPGTIGGAVFGNAGAFGGEMKDSISEVVSVDISPREPRVITRKNEECLFDYRSSVFKKNALAGKQEVIVETRFALRQGEKEEIKRAIQEKIDYRNERHPMEHPNIGSMFKNAKWDTLPEKVQERFEEKKKDDPFPVLPVAVLIDAAGLKGLKVGGAQVSEKHPNFIVNINEASSEDVAALCEKVQEKVKQEFGVELEREVIFK